MSSKRKLGKTCKTCGKLLLDKNKTGFCKQHVDWSGANNPFYRKTHTKEVKDHIRELNRTLTKKKWEDPVYREHIISSVSKPRSEEGKKNISLGVLKSYDNNPELRELRRQKMIERIEKGYNPNNRNSFGETGFINDVFYASKLELKRINFFIENGIDFQRCDSKNEFRLKYIDPFTGKERFYYPDFIYTLNGKIFVEEIKYGYSLKNLITIAKYKAAFQYFSRIGITYYIVTEKYCDKMYVDIMSNIYNKRLRQYNTSFFAVLKYLT